MESIEMPNMVLFRKQEEFPAIVKAEKMENEEEEQQPEYYSSNMETSESNSCIKFEEIFIKSEESDYERSVQPLESDINSSEVIDIQQKALEDNNKDLENAALPKINIGKHSRDNSLKIYKYACKVCSYQTRYSRNLNLHMLSHGDLPGKKMYKCTLCSYQSRYKYNQDMHMVKHKSSSEVKMYKCGTCAFETKYKKNLDRHIRLSHLSTPCQVPIYTCDLCSFQSKIKRSIERHGLVHKSCDEVIMYACSDCSFQTKLKQSLARHMVIHKKLIRTNVTTYKCEKCIFVTKYKRSLTRHQLIHKRESNK